MRKFIYESIGALAFCTLWVISLLSYFDVLFV
jgi:hypothetical protein